MHSLTSKNVKKNIYLGITKSFLIWCLTLTVCLLVVGFPLGVLLVTCGILATVILQAVLPSSAVVLVAGSILCLNVFVVVFGAAVLTVKGIHPEEVTWLNWLHGAEDSVNTSVYASCPLTCDLSQVLA